MRKIRLIAEAVCLITSMTITPVVTSVEKNDSMVVETVAEASQTPVLKSANVIPILQSEDTTNSLKLKGLDNDQVNTEIVKETIGGSAFEETSVEVVTLPESIKSIGKNAFVGKRNGKREMHITIEATTPPTIDGSFAKHADADVTVPDGCLGNYISIDLGKPFKNSGDTKWGGFA